MHSSAVPTSLQNKGSSGMDKGWMVCLYVINWEVSEYQGNFPCCFGHYWLLKCWLLIISLHFGESQCALIGNHFCLITIVTNFKVFGGVERALRDTKCYPNASPLFFLQKSRWKCCCTTHLRSAAWQMGLCCGCKAGDCYLPFGQGLGSSAV